MLGGAFSTQAMGDWLNGKTYPYMDIMQSGDFYTGVDKDLVNQVTPILNTLSDNLEQTLVSMDTGSIDSQKVTRIRQIN